MKLTWSEGEVMMLVAFVGSEEFQQPKKWKVLSERMGTKTARQCFDYYNNHFREGPGTGSRPEWTRQKENLLVRLKYNNCTWKQICAAFPSATLLQLKNRYREIMRRRQKAEWAVTQERSAARRPIENKLPPSAPASLRPALQRRVYTNAMEDHWGDELYEALDDHLSFLDFW